MAASRLIAATLVGVVLAGCSNVLPRPDYVDVQTPAAFRTEQPGGARIDNADYRLDAEGFRVDKQGERIGMIDVPAKTEGDNSNAVAGYYISSTGRVAPGRVASTSDIVPPPGSQPVPSQMPQQVPITPAPANVPPPPGYR
jgi:hypothetical protein